MPTIVFAFELMHTTCQQKGVQGYPTVILYLKDGSEKTFEDERTMDKLVKFVQANV